jgi:hypothetical protein
MRAIRSRRPAPLLAANWLPVCRHFARPCLDWSERRPHLAGALGAGIASALLDRQWLRRARTARGIEVTSQGSAAYAVPSASISNSAP